MIFSCESVSAVTNKVSYPQKENIVGVRQRYSDCWDFFNLAKIEVNLIDTQLVLRQLQFLRSLDVFRFDPYDARLHRPIRQRIQSNEPYSCERLGHSVSSKLRRLICT
jgi:hypothetical protein